MIQSEHYKNYKGPNLTRAQIWKHGEEKLDITEYIKEFYGYDNNWQGKLYTYDDIFPNKNHEYKFKVEFVDDSNRKHWFHGMVGESEQYFNPPLASPMNQIS
tara:strand:+ start:64 stop:369 length:306 start_codon:yes stop_codon:yes gene_type:complete